MAKRQVNFYVTASGEGVANSNGGGFMIHEYEENGIRKNGENTLVPKMTNLRLTEEYSGIGRDGAPYKGIRKMDMDKIDFNKSRLFVSKWAVNLAINKKYFDTGVEQFNEPLDYLKDARKLFLTGFMVAGEGVRRAGSAHITNFIAIKQNCTFDVQSNNTSRNDETGGGFRLAIVSPGRNVYVGIVRIPVEEIQFISLDGATSKQAFDGTKLIDMKTLELNDSGKSIEADLNQILKDMNSEAKTNLNPSVKIGFVRKFGKHKPVFGIKLNADAVKLNIMLYLENLKDSVVSRAGGFMQIDEVEVEVTSGIKVKTEFLDNGTLPTDIDGNIKDAEIEDIYVNVENTADVVAEWKARNAIVLSDNAEKAAKKAAEREVNDKSKKSNSPPQKKKSLE